MEIPATRQSFTLKAQMIIDQKAVEEVRNVDIRQNPKKA